MQYLVIKSWYPSYLSSEVAKKFLEVSPKYPPDKTFESINQNWKKILRS